MLADVVFEIQGMDQFFTKFIVHFYCFLTYLTFYFSFDYFGCKNDCSLLQDVN